jgi:hypothetical protein
MHCLYIHTHTYTYTHMHTHTHMSSAHNCTPTITNPSPPVDLQQVNMVNPQPLQRRVNAGLDLGLGNTRRLRRAAHVRVLYAVPADLLRLDR